MKQEVLNITYYKISIEFDKIFDVTTINFLSSSVLTKLEFWSKGT